LGGTNGRAMNRSQIVSVAVVGMTLVALGVAATSLETTLTTDPDEEINPNWEALPIDEEVAAAIQDEMDEDESDQIDTAGTNDDSSSDSEPESELATRGEDPAIQLGPGPFTVTEPGHEPPEKQEASPLRSLLPWAIGLGIVLLAVGTVVYRSNNISNRPTASNSTADADVHTPASPATTRSAKQNHQLTWPDAEPTTVVDRAWVQLVEQLDIEQPATATADTCVQRARETGVDIEAVETIATAFEAVQYGGQPASQESVHIERALKRLDGDDT